MWCICGGSMVQNLSVTVPTRPSQNRNDIPCFNTGPRGRLHLFVSSLLINLSQILSPWTRPSLGWTTLNCVLFFLYILIFILCARGNRSPGMLEVFSGDLRTSNNWYHSKYAIPGYCKQQLVFELMVFFKIRVLKMEKKMSSR